MSTTPWKLWKKGFDAWEKATAAAIEKMMANPAILGPAGGMLSAFMKAKAASDKAAASAWGSVGLPTKRDQERALHKLNMLETRLMDLEERLVDAGLLRSNPTETTTATPHN